ncbi:DUF6287 domain-containing protein [Streptococcus macacae]|nr:DUF6287 domain-containing protein [Streptococcus macacae]SUN78657.1 lipoprotein [Streptococcus macacae NCTC 11558]
MPRHRATRRRSNTKFFRNLLVLVSAVICMGLAAYFIFSQWKPSNQAVNKEAATHITNPKKDPQNKDKKTETSSALDMAAIERGDYSSAAGSWQNELGDKLQLNASGIESANIKGTADFTLSSEQAKGEGIYQARLTSKDGTAVYHLIFVKAGTTIPSELFNEGFSDTSDTSKDRLYIASQETFGSDDFAKNVLYKTN